MALNFPSTPSVNDTYTLDNKTWKYNGTAWDLVSSRYTLGVSTYTSETSITPNLSTTGTIIVTAQAAGITFNNSTGSPAAGQKLIIRIKDNGTARSIGFGTQYRASTDLALPTTTTLGKTMYMGFIWNNTDSKLDLVALLDNF